jgi:hypothetical protein
MQPRHVSLKETFHVAGDAPDPAGTDLRGVSPGYDFTRAAAGHPFLHYTMGREIFIEADVYAIGDEPPHIILHCPWCIARGRPTNQTGLRIRADAKPFSYEPEGVVPPFPGWTVEQMRHAFPRGAGGLLSIAEPIACTWEEDPALERGGDGISGLSRCGWKVVIENNVIRDVR